MTGGTAGQILYNEQGNCTTGSTNGAVDGQAGTELTSLAINESTTPYAGCAIALPNGIIDFQGYPLDENSVQLTWNVDSEVNIAHYIVKRSRDGHDYLPIDEPVIAQNVQSSSTYSIIDDGAFVGANYYRLEAISYDGVIMDIRNVLVMVDQSIAEPMIIPNPVKDQFTAVIESKRSGEGVMEIYSISGERIQSKPIILKKGLNSIACSATNLAPGAYLLRIYVDQDAYNVRFIVE